MSDLRDLYQEMILDHGRRPRNFRALEGASHTAEGYNPLCGDRLTLWLKVEDGAVKDAGFQGAGCAISTSSASLLTASIKGRTLAEVEVLFGAFHRMVTGEDPPEKEADMLGKLAVFSGVREFPLRVKCATLAWHTLQAALEGRPEPVTTEE